MTKNKHDHTTTKKIKAWLFAIMLLLPFLFLLPTGLYYGLNQNAQLSERTETTDNYFQWSNPSLHYNDLQLENNVIYYFTLRFSSNSNFNCIFDYLELANFNNSQGYYEIEYTKEIPLYIKYDYDTDSLEIQSIDYYYYVEDVLLNGMNINFYGAINLNTDLQQFVNLYDYSVSGVEYDYLIANGTNSTTTYTNDISTSIINAWNSTWQNPLFSWTSYSPFYAPMQSFTNVFGINNMQIANVLTYLATITAIYIVFDIIIELFTYLTHLIPRSD